MKLNRPGLVRYIRVRSHLTARCTGEKTRQTDHFAKAHCIHGKNYRMTCCTRAKIRRTDSFVTVQYPGVTNHQRMADSFADPHGTVQTIRMIAASSESAPRTRSNHGWRAILSQLAVGQYATHPSSCYYGRTHNPRADAERWVVPPRAASFRGCDSADGKVSGV